MNKSLVKVLMFLVTLFIFVLVIIRNESPDIVVHFETNGGTKINDKFIKKGSSFDVEEISIRDNYIFDGWFRDPNFVLNFKGSEESLCNDVVLYAKWKLNINLVRVDFETNGGTEVDDILILKGQVIKRDIITIKEGFKFLGWYKEKELINIFDTNKDKVNDNIILYAAWEKIVNYYKVSFYDGDTLVDQVIVIEDSILEYDKVFEKEEYIFIGYYIDKEFNIVFDFNTKINSDTSIYLYYEIKTYTVSFVTNSDFTMDSVIVNSGDYLDSSIVPKKEGYTFIGWYKESELINFFNQLEEQVTSYITLYAKYEPIFSLVSFDTNGGTELKSINVQYGSLLDNIDVPIKAENDFDGLFKESDMINKWDFSNDRVYYDITLYASWDIYVYTITFYSAGGTKTPDVFVNSGDLLPIPNTPYKEGHTFLAWRTRISTGIEYDFNLEVRSNFRLYASWETNIYTITFETNGGEELDSYWFYYGALLIVPTPVKEGFVFDAWYLDSELTEEFDIFYVLLSDITLYAKYL